MWHVPLATTFITTISAISAVAAIAAAVAAIAAAAATAAPIAAAAAVGSDRLQPNHPPGGWGRLLGQVLLRLLRLYEQV